MDGCSLSNWFIGLSHRWGIAVISNSGDNRQRWLLNVDLIPLAGITKACQGDSSPEWKSHHFAAKHGSVPSHYFFFFLGIFSLNRSTLTIPWIFFHFGFSLKKQNNSRLNKINTNYIPSRKEKKRKEKKWMHLLGPMGDSGCSLYEGKTV